MQIAVIGAGVVGVSVAARLAERGAEVTLVDQADLGSGTSGTSYGWVNANGKEPSPYFDINFAGLEMHRRLAADGGMWLGTGGHVEFAVDDAHRRRLSERLVRLSERGYDADEISRDRAAELLPDVRIPHDTQLIAYFSREAYAYPSLYLASMLGRARDAGTRVITGTGVAAFGPSPSGGAEVSLMNGTTLNADIVVSAAGRWTSDLLALSDARDIPMQNFSAPGDATVGYLAVTTPVPVRLTRLVTSPWLNVRPAGGGRLLLQALDLDVTADPGSVPGPDSDLARELLRRLARVVTNTEGARIERLDVGQRAIPGDGRTVVGRALETPWLYIVATHSGITLAPYLGEGVAAEVNGEDWPSFAPFRPGRFVDGSAFAATGAPRHPGEQ